MSIDQLITRTAVWHGAIIVRGQPFNFGLRALRAKNLLETAGLSKTDSSGGGERVLLRRGRDSRLFGRSSGGCFPERSDR